MGQTEQIRMLPKELPRDPFHGQIIQAVLDGRLHPANLPRYFEVPGIGLHQALYTLTMMQVGYRQQGSQTFIVPKGMQEGLARTSLESVGCWDMKMPYPYLYLALPDCEYELWGGERTRWHKIGGAYLYSNEGAPLVYDMARGEFIQESREGPGCVTLYIWGMENDASEGPGDDASFYVTIDLDEMRKKGQDLEAYINDLITDDSKSTTVSLDGLPKLIQEALGADLPASGTGLRERVTENVRKTLRIIFNALLYIGSENADLEEDPETAKAQADREEYQKSLKRLKSPGKRKRVQRKLEALPEERVIWVGRTTPTEQEMESQARESGPGRRTWVRGHWWPRKDTIRNRLQASQKAVGGLERDLMIYRSDLKDSETAEQSAENLTAILLLEDQLAEAKRNHEALEDSLQRKLRWVRPYIRNKDSKDSIEGHTYLL